MASVSEVKAALQAANGMLGRAAFANMQMGEFLHEAWERYEAALEGSGDEVTELRGPLAQVDLNAEQNSRCLFEVMEKVQSYIARM